MAYLSTEEIYKLGFKALGSDVLISDKASVYGAAYITLGNNIRIDDFCILSAGAKGINIGNNVHIACYASLIGAELIKVDDFAGISSRVSIYSSNDDYSGAALTGPTIPDKYKGITNKPVLIGRHVVVGSGCIVLPGVTIGQGSAIAALSLVNKAVPEYSIYGGVPAKFIKPRLRNMEILEKQYLAEGN